MGFIDEKQELKDLIFIASKFLTRKEISKIRKIDDVFEKKNILHYVIKNELNFRLSRLKEKIGDLKKLDKDVFFIKIKINLLSLKLKSFMIHFSRNDFKKILDLFKKIEKEIKNV